MVPHPDDETLFGALLAEACIDNGATCRFAVMTTGEGGNCSLRAGCEPDVGTVRMAEMRRVAQRYGAQLHWGSFRNHPHVTDGGERWLATVLENWQSLTSPVGWIRSQVNDFSPTLVLTVDGSHGFYGHAEHVLAGRLVEAALGVRPLSDVVAGQPVSPATSLVESPRALVQVLNRYPVIGWIAGKDPPPVTQTWRARRSCGAEPCIDRAAEIAGLHASQRWDGIFLFQLVHHFIQKLYLRVTALP